MKPLDAAEFLPFLIKTEWAKEQLGEYNNKRNATMVLPYNNVGLRIIAASGMGWDHVSVSLPDRTPTWEEMSYVHRKLFYDDEVVMQLHVPSEDHINVHPYTLHLWRPRHSKTIPMPPKSMV